VNRSSSRSIWLFLSLLILEARGILLRAFGGDGWKDAGVDLNLLASWGWYL
jgi:hypothetical protein